MDACGEYWYETSCFEIHTEGYTCSDAWCYGSPGALCIYLSIIKKFNGFLQLQKPNDPNLSFCPADHPFIPVAQLEAEGTKLMEAVITIFYTMPNPDMVAAVVNSWGNLAKLRPSQTPLIISALSSWQPGAISESPFTAIRSVEKAVRILLTHFSRVPQISASFAGQISDALAQQATRMERAAAAERNRKANAAAEANRKRSITALSNETNEAKRLKTGHSTVSSVLANFDFSSLPHTLVTDLIVANLQVLSEQSLSAAVQVGSLSLICAHVKLN